MMNRFFISAFLLLFISCDPIDDRLVIINQTNRPLFFSISRFDSIEEESPLQDYMKISGQDTLWIDSDVFIKPYGKNKLSVISSWQDLINHNYSDQRLKLFIFDADTLKKYDWNTVKSDSIYYHRFKYSVKELKELNWEIVVNKSR